MSVIAFTHKGYDDVGGIAPKFRGQYEDIKEALKVIRGDRYDHDNLEIMDLSTLGWTYYRWQPYYEWSEIYDATGVDEKYGGPKRREFLKKRWDDKAEKFEIHWVSETRQYDDDTVYFDAGFWEPKIWGHLCR